LIPQPEYLGGNKEQPRSAGLSFNRCQHGSANDSWQLAILNASISALATTAALVHKPPLFHFYCAHNRLTSSHPVTANLIRIGASHCRTFLNAFPLLFPLIMSAAAVEEKTTHSFLAFGADTYLVSEKGTVEWTFPMSTRDGWLLSDGHLLLTISQGKQYPGGAVLEVTRDNKVLFEYKGSQAEVNTSQKLENGNILLTEAGAKPRILEVSADGKIVLDVPITCQLTNFHMQSRMARKLPNGNYLVPQLLDKVVYEYDRKGKVVWEVTTPNWPFTAIRLPNGHTLVNCTYGNTSIEVDAQRRTVWQLANTDFSDALIKDACGAQRLPNGNTVLTSYGIGANRTKLIEVTPDKKLIWSYTDERPHGIHHFQILTTNGKTIDGPALR
jgi:hypothetical protein